MDAYHVGRNVFSFVASSIDTPLRVCDLREQDLLLLPLSTMQRFEQDAQVLTMMYSFLYCSGTTSTHLLEEAILHEGTLEGSCWLVGMLLELDCSRVRAVSHLLSSTITMVCNLKLICCNALLPSMMLLSAQATEAYQLLFDPSGSNIFGEALPTLLKKAGEVAIQKRHQSLEEAMVKSAKGSKAPKTSLKRPAPSGGQ